MTTTVLEYGHSLPTTLPAGDYIVTDPNAGLAAGTYFIEVILLTQPSSQKIQKATSATTGEEQFRVEAPGNSFGSWLARASTDAITAALNAHIPLDIFNRVRVSNQVTIFDSKLSHTTGPEFWDDDEVSGADTTSTHSNDRASNVLAVSDGTAGKRIRQSFTRPNYQPGKSQLHFMTSIIGVSAVGITSEIGCFDDENGVFYRSADGVMYVVVRSHATGSPVDTAIPQSSWNLDVMDGTGASGVTLDFSKTQIFIMEYQWLGVGAVRFGVSVDGSIHFVHQFNHANNKDVVYMSTPNNPLRYSIENDGTGPAATMEQICCSVVAEGGYQPGGANYWFSTAGAHVDAATANVIYAVVGARLKLARKGQAAFINKISALTTTNDDIEWLLIRNPDVAGTFTYSDEGTTPFQVARGVTANVVTNGHVIAGGFIYQNATDAAAGIKFQAGFGEAIDGTRDEFVLCIRPLSAGADVEGGMEINTLL